MPPDLTRDRPSARNLRRLWKAEVEGKLCRTPRERLAHRHKAEQRKAFLAWFATLSIGDMSIVYGRLQAGEDTDAIKREMSLDEKP